MSLQFSDDVVAAKFFEMADNVAKMSETLKDLPELKKTVDKHERIYTVGKYAAIPLYGALHLSVKHVLAKLGW